MSPHFLAISINFLALIFVAHCQPVPSNPPPPALPPPANNLPANPPPNIPQNSPQQQEPQQQQQQLPQNGVSPTSNPQAGVQNSNNANGTQTPQSASVPPGNSTVNKTSSPPENLVAKQANTPENQNDQLLHLLLQLNSQTGTTIFGREVSGVTTANNNLTDPNVLFGPINNGDKHEDKIFIGGDKNNTITVVRSLENPQNVSCLEFLSYFINNDNIFFFQPNSKRIEIAQIVNPA